MKLQNIKNFLNGWVVGIFKPSLFESKDVEVALKVYTKGQKEPRHLHKIATEYTIVVSGKIKMNGIEFFEGDIVIVEPGESTDFEAMTDCKNLIIKTPSCTSDKYLV